MSNRFIIVILIIAIVLNAGFYMLVEKQPAFSFPLLTTGNLVMAVLCTITFLMVKKNINERPQAFIRGVYGGTFLKLFVCLVGILSYAMIFRATLHKPSLFILFGIYAVYTIAETWMLQSIARKT